MDVTSEKGDPLYDSSFRYSGTSRRQNPLNRQCTRAASISLPRRNTFSIWAMVSASISVVGPGIINMNLGSHWSGPRVTGAPILPRRSRRALLIGTHRRRCRERLRMVKMPAGSVVSPDTMKADANFQATNPATSFRRGSGLARRPSSEQGCGSCRQA